MKSPPANFDASRHERHEQILRHFAGTLEPGAQRALNEALASSETLRQEFALLAVQQVHLGQVREEEAGKIVALDTAACPKVRPWFQRWPMAAAAAAVLLLSVAYFWPKDGAQLPEVRLASVQGEVWIEHGDTKHRAKAGLALRPGAVVQTAFGAETVLVFANEPTRLLLTEESVFTLPATNAGPYLLEAGSVAAVVGPRPRGRPLRFRTPQAEAVILGTKFHLNCNASMTHLVVEEGKVNIGRLADNASARVLAGQFAAVRENAPVTASPLPPAGQGTGLLGEYFPRGSFAKPTFRRLDARVQFDWGADRPGARLNIDHFQARWTGWVQAKFSERYVFELVADDGVRLWVDGQLLVDQWDIRSSQTKMRGEIVLQAGRKYDLKLEYYEASGKAFVSLYWQSDSQPREIIPSSQLYPPSLTVLPDNGK
jgi:hypothetical protein